MWTTWLFPFRASMNILSFLPPPLRTSVPQSHLPYNTSVSNSHVKFFYHDHDITSNESKYYYMNQSFQDDDVLPSSLESVKYSCKTGWNILQSTDERKRGTQWRVPESQLVPIMCELWASHHNNEVGRFTHLGKRWNLVITYNLFIEYCQFYMRSHTR